MTKKLTQISRISEKSLLCNVSMNTCHSLIVTQFVCQDFSSLFPFLSFFTKQIFLLTSLFLCKKQVKNVDNVDNFVNNSIFPPFLNPQNVDNYSHLSLAFDVSTNIN